MVSIYVLNFYTPDGCFNDLFLSNMSYNVQYIQGFPHADDQRVYLLALFDDAEDAREA